jgi:NAD(P)-dependent dehydrogenase (short-subunit alcohol dehydrogenase family)
MKRVLITGCSTGIGRATALHLGELGYEVVATARKVEAIADIPAAMRLRLDVCSEADVQRAVESAGPVDVLVNNAGVSIWGPVETLPPELVERNFATNLLGGIRMVQAFAPGMRERRSGAIVNVGSVAGRMGGMPVLGWYSAAKAAVDVLTEALARELAPFGVRAVLIEPGAVDTMMPVNRVIAGIEGTEYESTTKPFFDLMRQRRAGAAPPEQVARVIAAALTDDSSTHRRLATPDAAGLLPK